jgi:hypothetical protein
LDNYPEVIIMSVVVVVVRIIVLVHMELADWVVVELAAYLEIPAVQIPVAVVVDRREETQVAQVVPASLSSNTDTQINKLKFYKNVFIYFF